jgi:hypothetical protein
MTLTWTVKILMFVFLSRSNVKLHTEKKRPTGGWGHAVQWAVQMHVVGVLVMCSRTGKCSATHSHAVYHVLLTYPGPVPH